jgi:hypothetical protein
MAMALYREVLLHAAWEIAQNCMGGLSEEGSQERGISIAIESSS